MKKLLLAVLVSAILAPSVSLAESEVKKEAAELGAAIKKDTKKIAKKTKETAKKAKTEAKKAWKKAKAYVHEKTAD